MRELQARGYPVELYDRRRAGLYSAVVYSKRYDDASYEEAITLKARGIRIVFDLCDNHFYNPRDLPGLRRAGEQARRMMAIADHLVASTDAMAEVMRTELTDVQPITVIGDAVETDLGAVPLSPWRRWWARRQWHRVQASLQGTIPDPTRLIWFGVHGGPGAEHGVLDLLKLEPLLARLAQEFPLSLTVISNSRRKFDRTIGRWAIPTRYLEWSPETFLAALRAHDIAVLPVSGNPFTRCKSNNRLALALHAGLAVIADEIPSYRGFARACFLNDWEAGLETYLRDPARRRQDSTHGHDLVSAGWTIPVIADQWEALFANVHEARPPSRTAPVAGAGRPPSRGRRTMPADRFSES
jgi:hypothetical protein